MSNPMEEACDRLNGAQPLPDAEIDALFGTAAFLKAAVDNDQLVVPGFDKLAEEQRTRMMERLHQRAEEVGRDAPQAGQVLEVPRLDVSGLCRGDFISYLRRPVPLVLEGAAARTRAVMNWTPAYLRERYGDFVCTVAHGYEHDLNGSIAGIVDAIENGTEAGEYIHNVADFFNANPDAEADLEYENIVGELLDGQRIGTQLFLGGAQTGTAYHASNNFNVFVNVYGQKEWFFSHPKHTPWMYGELDPGGIYASSPIDHNKSSEEQAEWPLYAQIPVYRALLQPGDVLLSPNWWWHAINNVSPSSIGCASRWYVPGSSRSYFPFSLTQQFVPHYRQIVEDIAEDPSTYRITDDKFRQTYGVKAPSWFDAEKVIPSSS